MYVSFISIKDRVFKHTYIIKSLLMRNCQECVFSFFTTKHRVFQTYIHEHQSWKGIFVCFKECMRVYVCFIFTTGTGFSDIHTCSRTFRSLVSSYCVCMFETSIHTRLRASNIHTYTLEGFRDIHTHMLSRGS